MTTITIPKNLIKEKDLMLISRIHYENLLKISKRFIDREKSLWQNSSRNKFLKSYGKSDIIYDSI